MSTIIDRSASSTEESSNGQAKSRIVHFDATARRKEKMRQQATADPKTVSPKTTQPAATAVAPSNAPPPAAKTQTTKAAEPTATKRNGAFAHPAAGSPAPPAPAATPNSNGSANNNGAAAMPAGAELEKFLVEFVVEQTGYPEEMVELDADLEADLGIDSIKKAQLFGELAERFHVDVQGADELSLDDFSTLRHVKSFLESAGFGTTAEASPVPEPIPAAPAPTTTKQTSNDTTPTTSAVPQGAELEQFLIGFVVEQTGYPEEMVEMDADLEADLGIDSIKKAQLFGELAEQFTIDMQSADELSLDDFATLRDVMAFLEGASQSSGTPPAPTSVAAAPTPVAAAPAETPVPVAAADTSATANRAGTNLNDAELEKFLIDFVVEQTGYPEEMIELDADLEADLGIDSIKKAQLFGELAEQFSIDVQSADDLSLDDFTTLRHVMRFLQGNSQPTANTPGDNVAHSSQPTPSASPAPSTPPVSQPSTPPSSATMSDTELEEFLINFVVEQTGYPPEMVEMDVDLESDLGIDSIKKAQLFGELAEQFALEQIQQPNVQSDEEMSLDDFPTLRHVMKFLEGAPQKATV